MDNYKYDSEGTIKRLYDQESLLDILIEVEGVFDSMDLYAFSNWFEGELVKGPNLERYWVSVVLKYPYEKMPDPRGGMRLIKHGAKIKYIRSSEEVQIDLSDYRDNPQDAYVYNPKTQQSERKTEEHKIWLVEIKLPRRFVQETEKGQVYLDDEEDDYVDLTAADEAENLGLDHESAIEGEANNEQDK